MTKFYAWLFRFVVKQVLWAKWPQPALADMYRIIRDEVDRIYTEDNAPTLDAYTRELFEESTSEHSPR